MRRTLPAWPAPAGTRSSAIGWSSIFTCFPGLNPLSSKVYGFPQGTTITASLEGFLEAHRLSSAIIISDPSKISDSSKICRRSNQIPHQPQAPETSSRGARCDGTNIEMTRLRCMPVDKYIHGAACHFANAGPRFMRTYCDQ